MDYTPREVGKIIARNLKELGYPANPESEQFKTHGTIYAFGRCECGRCPEFLFYYDDNKKIGISFGPVYERNFWIDPDRTKKAKLESILKNELGTSEVYLLLSDTPVPDFLKFKK